MTATANNDDGTLIFPQQPEDNFYGNTRSSLKYEMRMPQLPDFYWSNGKYVHQKCGRPTQVPLQGANRSKPVDIVCEHCTEEDLAAQEDD